MLRDTVSATFNMSSVNDFYRFGDYELKVRTRTELLNLFASFRRPSGHGRLEYLR